MAVGAALVARSARRAPVERAVTTAA